MNEYEYDPSFVKVNPVRASDLTELMSLLEQNSVVLGRQRASSVDSFIEGFFFGCPEEAVKQGREMMAAFNSWIHRRFDVETTQGWSRIIEFFSPDERESLSLFWSLWNEFCLELKSGGQSKY